MKRRNPHLMPYLDFLLQSDRWPLSALENYQFEQCKALCLFAQQHSRYYQERFADYGFDPKRMQSVEDLQVLPTIGKDDLRMHRDEIAADYIFPTMTLAETNLTKDNEHII